MVGQVPDMQAAAAHEEQVSALENRIQMAREAAANLKDAEGNRVAPLDTLIQDLQQLLPAESRASQALATLSRVADLSLLQLSLYIKQNDSLKRYSGEMRTIVQQQQRSPPPPPASAPPPSSVTAQTYLREIDSLKEQLQQRDAAMSSLRTEAAQVPMLRAQLQEKESASSVTQSAPSKASGKVPELIAENKRAREMVESLQRNVAERDVQVGELQASLAESERQLAAAQGQGASTQELMNEINTLKRENAELDARRKAQNEALDQASKALQAVQQSELDASRQSQDLATQQRMHDEEIARLQRQLTDERAEMQRLRELLMDAQRAASRFAQPSVDVPALKAKLEQAQEQVKWLEGQVESRDTRILELSRRSPPPQGGGTKW